MEDPSKIPAGDEAPAGRGEEREFKLWRAEVDELPVSVSGSQNFRGRAVAAWIVLGLLLLFAAGWCARRASSPNEPTTTQLSTNDAAS